MDSLQRVEALADHLLEFAGVERPPVPLSLVHAIADVRLLYVDWRYHQGCTLDRGKVFFIAINANDPDGERRFTVFHELFHVIERVQPSFGLAAACDWHDELLADHFATSILLNDRWFPPTSDDSVDDVAAECGVMPAVVRKKLASRPPRVSLEWE